MYLFISKKLKNKTQCQNRVAKREQGSKFCKTINTCAEHVKLHIMNYIFLHFTTTLF